MNQHSYHITNINDDLSVPHIVTLSPAAQTVAAEGTALFDVTLFNPDQSSADTYNLSLAGIPDGWTGYPATVPLAAGEKVTVFLTITVPAATDAPDTLPVIVDVSNSGGATDQAAAWLTVIDGVDVTITPDWQTADPGETVTYTLTISNYEGVQRTYTLSATGLSGSAFSIAHSQQQLLPWHLCAILSALHRVPPQPCPITSSGIGHCCSLENNMAVLHISLLGSLTLAWDELPLPPPSGVTARSLFAYLLTYRGRPHTRDLLAGTFWPDLPDAVARRRLSRALWQIRHSLQLEDLAQPILLTEGDTVQLHPDLPVQLDVEEFATCSSQCTVTGPGHLEQCESCLALYQGDFLAGYYDDWVLVEREQLQDKLLIALERLVEGYKGRGEYDQALIHARRLAIEAPWREEAHREVMRLCHLSGRDDEALKQFETCRQTLAQELNADPSPETVALAREIATHDSEDMPGLELPQAPPQPSPIVVDGNQENELPLIGREQERGELLAQVDALFQGLGGLVLVEGEAGVGKTRLLQTVARDAEWRGAEVLWGAAQEVEASIPYSPLAEALAEGLSPPRAGQLKQLVDRIWLQVLSRLLPSLANWLPGLSPAPQIDPAREQERLVSAVTHFLAGWRRIKPLVVVLENLHWAGEDTLDLLARLVPPMRERGVLLVGSYRGEDARALPRVWEKLQAMDRAGVQHRLVLKGLGAAATGELVRRCLGLSSPVPIFETRLYGETEGNPLFVLETLRAWYGEGLLARDANGHWSTPWDETTSDYAELPLPQAVEQTIARRLAFLSPALQQMVHLAAVLGERFDFALLLAASDEESPSVLAALGELVQCRFLDETERDYRFSHDKIRQVAYEGIDAGARVQLHHQAACAFEAVEPDQVAALAHHWTGAEVWDKASEYHQQAGDRAQAVYASAEAVAHYSQALEALGQLGELSDPVQVFELRLAREAVYGIQGQRAAQADELAVLRALAEALDDQGQQAEVALRQATFASITGDYWAAIMEARTSVELSQVAGDTYCEAISHLRWGAALEYQGNSAEAWEQFEQALALAQATGTPKVEADSLRGLGIICARSGDHTLAKVYLQQSLHISREIDDRKGESMTLINLGSINFEDDYYEAKEHCRQALLIEREFGNRYGEGQAFLNLGLTSWIQGDYTEARDYYKQALIITREVGDRQGESIALSNLARISHYLRNDESSLEFGQRSLTISRGIGDRYVEGFALTYVGHALVGLGQLAEASNAYREAIALRREIGQLNFAMESQAGLIRVHLIQRDASQAGILTEEILTYLESDGLGGMVEPFQTYLTCYHALQANDDARAPTVLTTAHNLLQEQAAKISDEATRRMFLEDVAAHREIVTTYCELQGQQQKKQAQVRLPRADVPTGRPLRDDEYVMVTWAVDAPEDAHISHKTARRRNRIQRLLAEAQAQGAVPRDQDLADVLGVSLPTIRRDMAALRAEGHSLPTRGRK